MPYKLSEAGFRVATEPIMQAGSKKWDDISRYILNLLDEISKNPLAGENRSKALDKIYGSRGFKQFSKRYICITVLQNLSDHKIPFIIFPDYQMEHMGWKKLQ